MDEKYLQAIREIRKHHDEEVDGLYEQIEELKTERDGYKQSWEGQKGNTLAFCDEVEQLRAEVERAINRIEYEKLNYSKGCYLTGTRYVQFFSDLLEILNPKG